MCQAFGIDPTRFTPPMAQVDEYDFLMTCFVAANRASTDKELDRIDLQAARTIHYLNSWWTGEEVAELKRGQDKPESQPEPSGKLSTQAEIDAFL